MQISGKRAFQAENSQCKGPGVGCAWSMCGITKKSGWSTVNKGRLGRNKVREETGGYSIQGLGGQCRILILIPSEMEAMGGF